MTETISAFARRHGLSRATVLYYERIGLVSPTGRTSAGHRLYGEDAQRRMSRVARFREAGLRLARIREILDAGEPPEAVAEAVEERLAALDGELSALRSRRLLLLGLLSRDAGVVGRRALTKELWVELLAEAGLDDDAMNRWHRAFEREAPDDHEAFLEALGLDASEIGRIREAARALRPGAIQPT